MPSPEKPFLHVHVNDPFVFVHVALSWQLCVLLAHSFISATVKRQLGTYANFLKVNAVQAEIVDQTAKMLKIFLCSYSLIILKTEAPSVLI